MKRAYIVNGHRYMNRQIYKTFRPSFAWYTKKVSDLSRTPKGWERQFLYGTTHKDWFEPLVLVDRERLNVPYKDSVWMHPLKKWYFDPETMTDSDHVMLPSGKLAHIDEDSGVIEAWEKRIAFPLDTDREIFRLQFNAISAVLATRFLDLDIVDILRLDVRLDSPGTKFLSIHGANMFLACDSCIFRSKCDFYKPNSTDCRIPMGKPGAFAELFGKGDSASIVTGLKMLVQRNAQRLEDAIADEDDANEGLNKDVTSLANQVFAQGVSLAKLIDPSLRAAPKVQVSVNGGNTQVTTGQEDPRAFAARAVKELQGHGVAIGDITNEVLVSYMAAQTQNDPRAIEAVVDNLRTVQSF